MPRSMSGSANQREIADAITKMPPDSEISVIIASDEPKKLSAASGASHDALLKSLSREIRGANLVGGQDNLPALTEAWTWLPARTTPR